VAQHAIPDVKDKSIGATEQPEVTPFIGTGNRAKRDLQADNGRRTSIDVMRPSERDEGFYGARARPPIATQKQEGDVIRGDLACVLNADLECIKGD
jgi:hypothetical protein